MSSKFGIILDPHLTSHPPASRKDAYSIAMFNKLLWIRTRSIKEKYRAIYILGDLFHTKKVNMLFLFSLIRILKSFPCPIHVLAGNHDLFNDNLSSLPRTALGVLFASNTVREGNGRSQGNTFTCLPYDRSMVVPEAPEKQGERILLCHAFVGWTKKADDWITFGEIARAGYTTVIAGHDHPPHAPKEIDVSEHGPFPTLRVLRPGSLSRGTTHNYNRRRQPTMMEITETQGQWSFDVIEVPAAKPKDIFAASRVKMNELNTNIRKFALSLENDLELEEGNLRTMLEQIFDTVGEDVRACITQYLTDYGIL